MELETPADRAKDRAAIQRDLGGLGEWADQNLLKPNRGKPHPSHMSREKPKENTAGKGQDALVAPNRTSSVWAARRGDGTMGWGIRSMARRSRVSHESGCDKPLCPLTSGQRVARK